MKMLIKIALVLIPTISLSASVLAHDPAMHKMKNEKADCKNMDHSKMDMKDPVVIAMMKKCMKQNKHSEMKHDHNKMDHSKVSTEKNKVKKNDGHSSHNH